MTEGHLSGSRRIWEFLFGKSRAGHEAGDPRSAEQGSARRAAAASPFFIRRGGAPRVQVGLDFGTSACKVMYVLLNAPQRVTRLLTWAGGHPDYPSWCVPSLAAFDEHGQLLLGDAAAIHLAHAPWGSGLSRFKMLMAGEKDGTFRDAEHARRYKAYLHERLGDEIWCPASALTATYLAWLMCQVRARLRQELGRDDLDCVFNTCLPIDQHASKVAGLFQRVMAVAQQLAGEPFDWATRARDALERAIELLPGARYDETADATRLFMVPEAIASAAAYTTSLRKQDGLHAFVDIGVGTTDVSIMNLHVRSGQVTTSYWYAARSFPVGMGRIEDAVARHLEAAGGAPAERSAVARALEGKRNAVLSQVVRQELERIHKLANKAWSSAYRHLKTQSCWEKDRVRVFLAGGGSQLPEARQVFRESWMRNWGPYPTALLPPPDGPVKWDPAIPFQRLSVAYGLTIPMPELGDFVLPAEAPNHTPPRPPELDITGPNPYW